MKFRKALTALVLGLSLYSTSYSMLQPLAWAAENPFTTTNVIRLDKEDRDAYVSKTMYERFHSVSAAPATVEPFAAPAGYEYELLNIPGIDAERIAPEQKTTKRVLIQFHGGGYVQPLHNGHRNLAVVQSQMAGGAEVYLLNYRVAPEHRFPSALDDAIVLYKHLLKEGYKADNIALIGDSAGGNLVLATALRLKDMELPLPKSMVLISPWLMMENTLPSRYGNFYKDVVLGHDSSALISDIAQPRYAAGTDLKNKYLSPLYGDLAGLPPMLIQSGEYETLLDDSLLLAAKARLAGVAVTETVYAGMPHDFAVCMPDLYESRASWQEQKIFFDKYMEK